MADLQITQLPSIASASVAATDPLALADISASETKKVTVKDLVARGVAVIDAATIPATALSYPLSADSIVTATILDANVTNAKLANSSFSFGGLTVSLGSTDDTPSIDLTDATNYPCASLSGQITNAQLEGSIEGTKLLDTTIAYGKLDLADGSIPGAKITSASLTSTQLGIDSVTSSAIAENAVGASEIGASVITNNHIDSNTILAGNIANNAIGYNELSNDTTVNSNRAVSSNHIRTDAITTEKIADSAVTNDKLAGSISGTKLLESTITSTQLGTNSVTHVELADNAVDTAAIAGSAVTDAKIASGVAGSKITDNTILPVKLSSSNLDRSLNVASGNLGINNAVTGGASTVSGISYNDEGLITSTTALTASDLPEATISAIGAVSVPATGGLSVTNLGELSITNSISASTVSGISYNAFGLITSTTALVAGDLPVATATAVGAISVPATSAPLAIDADGVLSLADSGVAAGTYEKVTVSASGIVTSGTGLEAADVPALDAATITTGQFSTARIADNAITMDQIGNYATCFIQETQPVITGLPAGVKWLQESTGQLRIFNGNSWFKVGFGRLSDENLRFGGTFRADTGVIVTLTTFGTSAGLTAGVAIPTGTTALTGVYLVCTTAGTGTSVNGSSFDNGDWILCLGADDWDRVDTLSGGGSGGASDLDDLTDVVIDTPTAGQFIEYASDGKWKNVSEIAGGTY